MSTITCTNCGYDENPSGTTFCEACGCELTDSSIPTTPAPPIETSVTPPPPMETSVSPPPPLDTFVPPPPVESFTPQTSVETPVSPPPPMETTMPPAPGSVEYQTPPSPSNFEPSGVIGSAKLVSKSSDYPRSQFELPSSDHIIVGRFDDTTGPVDIDLGDFPDGDTVSRNQAEIYFDGHQWIVKPISTTNGTYVKKAGQTRFGGALTGPEILNHGDEIAFTKLRFIFQSS